MRDEWHHPNVEDVLEQIPKNVQGIGEEVLHAISCGRHLLSWNDKLQLVINNRPVPRTNIVDLVQYILYPESEDAEPPRGFDTFLEGLKEIGLESQWVRNETVINALDNNQNNWDTTDEEDNESESESSDDSDDEKMEEDTTRVGGKDQEASVKWKNMSSDSDEDE